jgi:anionic cell wall polymer biosynthesis LytR-Cps2A-Psr (LCP) family protein
MQEMNQRIRGNNEAIGKEEATDCLAIPGIQLLNGRQTLAYVRNRRVGNNDFDRTLRQRKVLEQIYDQLKGLNIIRLKKLLDVVVPQVTTNLSEGEMLSIILSLPAYTKYTLDQWSVPMDNTYSDMNIRGMAVLGIDFEKNIAQLHQKLSLD